MAKGTTRKFGIPRYANGKPKPRPKDPAPGNDGVKRRRARYGISPRGDQTGDAIGRAYTNGLLGNFAWKKVEFAREDCERYWRIYGQFQGIDSVNMAGRIRGQAIPKRIGQEAEASRGYDQRRRALLDAVDGAVAGIVDGKFPYFELVRNRRHMDEGPGWLDAVIDAHRGGTMPPADARTMMRLALAALNAAYEATEEFRDAA